MWSTRIEELAYGRAVTVDFEKRPVKFSEVLRRWQDDPVFPAFFIALLADAPFSAFRWETPPISAASAVRMIVPKFPGDSIDSTTSQKESRPTRTLANGIHVAAQLRRSLVALRQVSGHGRAGSRVGHRLRPSCGAAVRASGRRDWRAAKHRRKQIQSGHSARIARARCRMPSMM